MPPATANLGTSLDTLQRRHATLTETFELAINGRTVAIDAPAEMPVLWVLRDLLGLTGTKFGCGIAQCGACTIHLDSAAVRSCVLPISSVQGRAITTIEAIGQTPTGRRVQQAWLEAEVVQCGYCQSGQVMSAVALLDKVGRPTDADIDMAMSGNICRCCTYVRIRNAIKQAATGTPFGMQSVPTGAAEASTVPDRACGQEQT
jgi:isoquinoline 1-oxidoreductase alpha subunit